MTPRRFVAEAVVERNAALVVALHLLGGALVLARLEGWAMADALYFSVTVLTTVGYGDLAPATPAGRLFTSLYVVVGVTLGAAGLGALVAKAQGTFSRGAARGGKQDHRRALTSAAAMAAALVSGGALGAAVCEGWGLVDSLYWAIVTCSSVGLGDLAPSKSNRPLAVIYILASVGGLASAAGRVASTVAALELERQVDAFVALGVSDDLVREMSGDELGSEISREAYLRFMLVATGRLESHELRQIDAQFDALDRGGRGMLRVGDLSPRHDDGDDEETSIISAARSYT